MSESPVQPTAPDLTKVAPSPLRSVHFAEEAPNPELAAEANVRLVELDGTAIEDKQALLLAIAEGFEFPDYFGGNWDALEECLRDLGSWLEAAGYAVVMEKGEGFWNRDAELAGMLVRTWIAAAASWVEKGVPFHLVFVR